MSIRHTKHEMPSQAPEIRAHNFKEVALGYTAEIALEEAHRCLNCKNPPCVQGCPVNIAIPDFIAKFREGDFDGAYQIISQSSALPAVCGRVCPQETQCESKCNLGLKFEPVAIGRLERFVADWHNSYIHTPVIKPESNGHKVAIVGAGPSGLTCAGDLARKGYQVSIFEALHTAGGVLVYGIPEFRLPKAIVAREVAGLEELGVKVVTNAVIGRAISVDDLLTEEGFEAVFLGSGAGLPRFLGIPGESLLGVYSANEYLTRINLMKAYRDDYDTPIKHHKRVAVVGAGNVAMDAARCAKRMGAEKVYIVYRRGMEEVPARKEEVHHAMEEEVEFQLLTNPVKVIGDANGYVTGIECIRMELGEPDERGRRRPNPVPDSNFVLEVDAMIDALGTSPNPLLRMTTEGLEADKHGCLIADEKGKTTREAVFAGGDAVTGAATVILAMGAGKTAAAAIDEYIKAKNA